MEQSPFHYHGPLEPEQVAGREELLRDLAERVMDRRLTALLGPRRYGKTSLLKRVAADLGDVGPEAVWIDLYGMTSVADLAGAVDRGLAAVTGPLRRVLDTTADSLSIRLGFVGVELSRKRRDRPDSMLVLRSLLDVLVRTARRRDILVVFDEFSGIAGVKGGAAALRTALQHHYQDLGIVFAGSEPSTMRTLFAEETQPFFAQADLVEIGPMDDADLRATIESGFELTGRDHGGHLPALLNLAQGHPQRAMQLADALWRSAGDPDCEPEDRWAVALKSVRASVDLGSERMFSMLPAGSRKVLRVVAHGGSIYGTSAEMVELAPGTARAAVDALMGSGLLARTAKGLTLVDPLLADWLRRRFP